MPCRLMLFLGWYYGSKPLAIVRGYAGYAESLLEIIPFGFLLCTLLSPWKNIVDRSERRGFDLKKLSEAISLNLLARAVGCAVRLLTIALGLMLHVLLFAFSLLYLLTWLLLPALMLWAAWTLI